MARPTIAPRRSRPSSSSIATACTSSTYPATRQTTTRSKQDRSTTGTRRHENHVLGSIIVVHPGHPLVGQALPVVRRYRERGERLWVIELPDESRQYVPVSWCTPLAPPSESPLMPGQPPPEEQPAGRPPGPLSLAGLRDLAALVRGLQERAARRGGEHDDVAAAERRRAVAPDEADGPGGYNEPPRGSHVARLGELPAPGSSPGDPPAGPDGAPAGPAPADGPVWRGTGVRQP